MAQLKAEMDPGQRNRAHVIARILRQPGISRTDIGDSAGLNVASVSRITRDLIEAGLVRETNSFAPKGRPGRKFVGLAPYGAGGYVIGIGMNAFRQSVTLADLENRKIAEWISPETPSPDGEAFVRRCLEHARAMVDEHVPDRSRFFGVGIAVAAELDKTNGTILSAPVFGWNDPIRLTQMVREVLDAPLVLDTPSSAINLAEADLGLGVGAINLTTLHCSLRFGLGTRFLGDDQSSPQEFGRVLTQTKAPDGTGRTLSEVCGGLAFLADRRGTDAIADRSDFELSEMLMQDISRSDTDATIRDLLHQKGQLTAQLFAPTLEMFQPERLLLAGPLAGSNPYVSGFTQTLPDCLGHPERTPDIKISDMTPTGASRWLALRGNVAMGNLDLSALKMESTS